MRSGQRRGLIAFDREVAEAYDADGSVAFSDLKSADGFAPRELHGVLDLVSGVTAVSSAPLSYWWIVLRVVVADVAVLVYRVGGIDVGGQFFRTVLDIVKWHLLLDSVIIGHFNTIHDLSLVIATRGGEYFGGPALEEELLVGADLLHIDLIETDVNILAYPVEMALWIRTADDGVAHHLLGHQLGDRIIGQVTSPWPSNTRLSTGLNPKQPLMMRIARSGLNP
jgi:hypothetical protein